ncbi:hypothetical protein GD605_01865 [Desulfolutivibrio sulfoxidireducens]|nr:hypothetical protein GD605_01865 [Desulfolutivibrio sulfoxidireducens]
MGTDATRVRRKSGRHSGMDTQDHLSAPCLDRLRRDIRDGIASGQATPWDPEELMREGRKRLTGRDVDAIFGADE